MNSHLMTSELDDFPSPSKLITVAIPGTTIANFLNDKLLLFHRSIRVSDFGVEDNGCSVTNTGSRFTIALSGISAEVAADWSRRR